ncbi:MAG: helix-turn-helix transcriptional regulator [Muribaculaceae bacterium]|nr:helix-turn-helix transcriptional regulator [Muribaculaceae bacterium]
MEIFNADSIENFNRFFGFDTRHPLVAIVNFNSENNHKVHHIMRYGFYALFLKKTTGCTINYGKTKYDFDGNTVISFAPGQTVEIERTDEGIIPEAVGLLFSPELLARTSLEKGISNYSFFSYASNEALILSEEECETITRYMNEIQRELQHSIDRFSKALIVSNIEILLNYCLRYYERQFITREEINISVISRFEQLLDAYINDGQAEKYGIPTVKYFSEKICLSPNYFGDLIKAETGKTAQEYIQLKMIIKAKQLLLTPELTTKSISAQLGFQHTQHFLRFFKKQVGMTPRKFRLQAN